MVENWGRIANSDVTGSIPAEGYELKHNALAASNEGTVTNGGPVSNSGRYTITVTDPQAARAFLRWKGMAFDEVSIPGDRDLGDLGTALRTPLDRDVFVDAGGWLDREYVLANRRQYTAS